jgi:hypothetical protein
MKHSPSLALTLIFLPLAFAGCAMAAPGNGSGLESTGDASMRGSASGAGGMSGAGGTSGAGATGNSGTTGGSGGTSGSGVAAGSGVDAGSGGTSGAGGTSGEGGAVGEGGSGGSVGGLDPIIPPVNGDCPTFMAGTNTVTVMGEPATVIAGAKKEGTGSLLFYWYGTGKLGDVSFLPQAIKDDITAQGGIVFAPQAAKNTGGDCSGTGTWGLDDFKISDQVAACAVQNYGINKKRIYATGCSAGGLQTGCMAIARSSYIAAVAPNSGGVTIGYPKLEDPMRVPNVITMNGGAGDNVIVNFGQTSEGFDNYILKYGGFAVNCIHNSGHCGAPASVYASAWQFMKDHPFGTKPSPYANGLPSGFDPVCKIFTMTSMAPLGGY